MFIDEKDFQYIKDLINGKYDNDPFVTELRLFFTETFGIPLIGTLTDTLNDGRGRLRFVISEKNQEFFMKRTRIFYGRDEEKEMLIKEKFSSLCAKYNRCPGFENPDSYFAVSASADEEMKKEMLAPCTVEIDRFLKSVKEIKKTIIFAGNIIVFFEKDSDINNSEVNGLSKRITDGVSEIVNKHDRYHYGLEIKVGFDSIQNLDENYGGSTQAYLKG